MHFYRNTLSRAFSVTITLLGAALFPDGLGIMHLPRDARTALFPKHSDRTFFRSTRIVLFPDGLGIVLFLLLSLCSERNAP